MSNSVLFFTWKEKGFCTELVKELEQLPNAKIIEVSDRAPGNDIQQLIERWDVQGVPTLVVEETGEKFTGWEIVEEFFEDPTKGSAASSHPARPPNPTPSSTSNAPQDDDNDDGFAVKPY